MGTDTLERLIITLSVRLHAFAYCVIQSGWRLAFDAMEAVTIHYVLKGSGRIEIDGGVSAAFAANSIVIVPARVSQKLAAPAAEAAGEAAADQNCTMTDDGLLRFVAGDGSADLLVVCGTISASYGGALGLFDHLREPVVEDCTGSNLIRHSFDALLEEIARPTVGTQVLTEALMKQCLIIVLRQHLGRDGVASPLLAPLRDQRLAQAVAAAVERPAAPHTVESLAAVAGMSRSAFAQAFAATYDQGPLDFVRRLRLRLAANLLTTTDLPIKVIAASIGYASRSYFSRAFKASYGTTPRPTATSAAPPSRSRSRSATCRRSDGSAPRMMDAQPRPSIGGDGGIQALCTSH
jgi:AraC family transcriptional regulator, activator of mtrCDE